MTLSFTLPYPPSVNTYWRHPSRGPLAGRHLISQEGRNYRETIHSLCGIAREAPLTGPLAVDIEAFFPDRRRRDLDNILKSLLDSLTHAGVWEDDSQITDLRIRKGPHIAGMVKVHISKIKEEA